MSRNIRFIAISLTVSVLIAASAQAVPWRVNGSKRAAVEEGMLASAWEWVLSWLACGAQGGLTAMVGADGSHADPNGSGGH